MKWRKEASSPATDFMWKQKKLQHITRVPPCRNTVRVLLVTGGPSRSQEDNSRFLEPQMDSEPGEQPDRV